MKSFSKLKSNVLGFNDQLPFGRFLGQKIDWIIQTRPSDILWAHQEGIATFSQEVLDECNFIINYTIPTQLEEQDIPQ
jgi:hypothetical protein